eukprot:CAMPEP_0202922954 /NCGR_PEP_ID=MMETSP1392-20130828/78196_1 /ASSEMBLY_ACC=CAM_ASM_000868 /TAXON_ID=225041 /ORGANISM="Chlamydomonas chlamydogama, Strain SAG 11-48b" /LENGTH=642 /DNA_ID=CAMNT_0049616611 /DNA_START=28 /DNA_END=1953 /DNA_ORIENTATION=+
MPATQHLPQGLSATLLKLVLQSFKSQSSLLLQDGGVVVSPVSILYAVALILNAAAPCSPTHSQLWSLLRACHPGGEEQLNHLLNHLLKLLTAPGKLPHAGAAQQASSVSRHPDAPPHLGGPPSEQYAPAVQPSEEVDIAVGVFLHETRLLPTFAARMLSTLNATAREVCSYLEVNAWLQQRTRGAVARGLRGYFPGAVLLSSLHFKHSQLWSLLRACHPGGEDHLNQLLNHLMVRLTTLPPPAQSWGGPARPPPQAEVCIANGIFLRQAVLHQAYVTKMRQLLQSSVQQVSSYQEVNDWVREQTRGKIQGVLSENFIGAVLANAVYFKGKWLQPFKKELTAPAPFASPSGPIMVNMMRADLKGVLHARVPGVLDAVCLPYEGGEYRAVLLLPARPGISLDETLTCFYSDAKQMSAARHSTVDLSLPRFKVEATIKLKEVMQGLGVTAPFTLGQADFSRMGPGTFFVEDAVHKAIVEVDEEGTVAAAVTAVTCFFGAAASPDPHVRLVFDRPFVHIIEHMATQLPLFVGKVLHPSQGEQPASRSDRKQGWPQQQGQPGQQGWPQQQGQQGWPQQLGQQGQHHPVYTGPFSHITAPATAPAASFLPNTAGPQASPAGVGQHGVMNQQREQGLQLVNAAGCPVRL